MPEMPEVPEIVPMSPSTMEGGIPGDTFLDNELTIAQNDATGDIQQIKDIDNNIANDNQAIEEASGNIDNAQERIEEIQGPGGELETQQAELENIAQEFDPTGETDGNEVLTAIQEEQHLNDIKIAEKEETIRKNQTEINENQRQIDESPTQIDERQNQINEHTNEIVRLDTEIEAKNQEIKELGRTVGDDPTRKQQLQALKEERTNLASERERLDSECETLSQDITRIQDARAALETRNQELTEQNTELTEQNTELGARNQELQVLGERATQIYENIAELRAETSRQNTIIDSNQNVVVQRTEHIQRETERRAEIERSEPMRNLNEIRNLKALGEKIDRLRNEAQAFERQTEPNADLERNVNPNVKLLNRSARELKPTSEDHDVHRMIVEMQTALDGLHENLSAPGLNGEHVQGMRDTAHSMQGRLNTLRERMDGRDTSVNREEAIRQFSDGMNQDRSAFDRQATELSRANNNNDRTLRGMNRVIREEQERYNGGYRALQERVRARVAMENATARAAEKAQQKLDQEKRDNEQKEEREKRDNERKEERAKDKAEREAKEAEHNRRQTILLTIQYVNQVATEGIHLQQDEEKAKQEIASARLKAAETALIALAKFH